jgi:Fe2+ or Zn2+ uptake regulation protein
LKKSRNTRQRGVILGILRAGFRHLTAEEVYMQAREALPSISLGTVYRNLNFLRDQGLAREVRNGDSGCARFEAARDSHAHFHCRCCQAVRDIPLPAGLEQTRWEEVGPIGAVSYLDLHVIGECADCSPVP